MKGYISTKPNIITESEIVEDFDKTSFSKVKITKALITLKDVLHFNGENRVENVVLGSYGVGVISDIGSNLYGIEKGKRVYVEAETNCNNCYNCQIGEANKCNDMLIAGEDISGFLRDFYIAKNSRLYLLPDSVSDSDAVFLGEIATALSIVNRLNIDKGDHIAIIGGTNLGIILSQILIYYQAVPILIDSNVKNIELAKKSGVYYTLCDDGKWLKELTSITGGRMAKGVVYMTDSEVSAKTAFSVASFGAPIVFSGTTHNNSSVSFLSALKKQLVIMFVNSGFGNATASINLIANKAVDLTHLNVERASYKEVPAIFEKCNKLLQKDLPINDYVIDLLK